MTLYFMFECFFITLVNMIHFSIYFALYRWWISCCNYNYNCYKNFNDFNRMWTNTWCYSKNTTKTGSAAPTGPATIENNNIIMLMLLDGYVKTMLQLVLIVIIVCKENTFVCFRSYFEIFWMYHKFWCIVFMLD